MATEAQITANRCNAKKSTGPRTPEAKAVISQNAVKHGLTAHQDVINSECQAEFDLYKGRILAELTPVGPMESMLAERIVSLSWRLKRAERIQNQAVDSMIAGDTNSPLARLTQSLLPKGIYRSAVPSNNSQSPLTLGQMAVKDLSNARVLERLLMYERRIENSLYKTTLALQRLQIIKKLDSKREMLDTKPIMQNKANFFTQTPAHCL